MPLVAILVQLLVLYGGTIAIFTIDRKRRERQGKTVLGEPEPGMLWVLAVLCNIACLPYYFFKTRGGVGLAIGIGLFLACMFASMLAGTLVRMLG